MSSAPSAITAAATTFIELVVKESDNNVKLIVLDRLEELKRDPQHDRVLKVSRSLAKLLLMMSIRVW